MSATLSPFRKKLLWGILALFLIGNGLTLVLLRIQETNSGVHPTPLARYGPSPDFSLTERTRRPFSKSELRGKPWVADFIFTSCAGQCPFMSAQMRRLQDEFPREGGIRFVSFTVDPKRDTPEVLSEYADRFRSEKGRWFFLTGAREEINRVLAGFHLSGADDPAMHSTRFVLVDSKDEIRGYYDGTDPRALQQLIHEAKILLKARE